MTRLQKAATIIALALCFAVAIGMEILEALQFPHAPIDQSTAAQHSHETYSETQKEKPEEAIARYNKWLTFFTAVLAVATVVLGLATVGLYLAGERQLRHVAGEAAQARRRRWQDQLTVSEQLSIARQNSEAAKKSADVAEAALTVAERPYLVPTEPKMKLWRYGPPGMPPVNPPEYIGTIQYGLFNMGRTVAFLKEVCVRLIFVEILPDSPSYQAAAESPNDTDPKIMAGHYPIGPEKPYDCPTYGIGLKLKMRPDTFNDIQSGKLKAFFFGYVRYTDVFDYLHTEGFCFRYTQIGVDQTPSICAIVAGKNYNYSRREKIPPEGFATLPPQGAELTWEDVEKLNAQMRAERGKPA